MHLIYTRSITGIRGAITRKFRVTENRVYFMLPLPEKMCFNAANIEMRALEVFKKEGWSVEITTDGS